MKWCDEIWETFKGSFKTFDNCFDVFWSKKRT